jgi:arsenate reductase (thioredoxin)
MKVSELAREAGIAPSAVRFYEETGVLPLATRERNGYRTYDADDLGRLRLVVALRRLGLGPSDAGRLARLCLERGDIDAGLAPLIAEQRAAIERQRVELDRLDAELCDLDETVRAVGRTRHPKEATSMPGGPIRVLFVCTGNSARSQLAEALLGQIGGAEFEANSAGTEPHGVNPYTVRVLAERGIDWSAARSKSVTEFLDERWDYVITVCDRARQVCPVFPGEHNSLHWGLDDPAEVEGMDEAKLAAFRATYMQLVMRIRPFVELARRAVASGLPG